MRRTGVDGLSRWTARFQAFSAARWAGQVAMRHRHDHGMTREPLAQVGAERPAHRDAQSARAITKQVLASGGGMRPA